MVENELFGFRQHPAGAAGRIIDRAEDARPVNVLLARIDEVRHQADDFARGEVVAGLFVRLFVEPHHQMLEQVSHLQIVDVVGVQVHVRHRLHDGEKPIAGIELFDLVVELEPLEDGAGGGREAVDIGDKVRRDVFGVAKQLREGKRAGIVERMLASRICRLSEQLLHRICGQLLGLQLLILLQHRVLGRLKHAVEPAQDNYRQHDQPILRWAIWAPQAVRDFPDVGF